MQQDLQPRRVPRQLEQPEGDDDGGDGDDQDDGEDDLQPRRVPVTLNMMMMDSIDDDRLNWTLIGFGWF